MTLSDRKCRAFFGQTFVYRNVVNAVSAEVGFQVLWDGDSYLDGRFQVWSVDADGIISEKSRWMTADQMLASGYDDVLNRDFNGDGLIAVLLHLCIDRLSMYLI